jgi:hypothetical protein
MSRLKKSATRRTVVVGINQKHESAKTSIISFFGRGLNEANRLEESKAITAKQARDYKIFLSEVSVVEFRYVEDSNFTISRILKIVNKYRQEQFKIEKPLK